MGPRSGSPAAETPRARAVLCRRASSRWRGTAIFICLLWPASSVLAASVETSHNVTVVVVPTALSVSDDAGDFSLEFDEAAAGSQSSPQVVNYRVSGNSLPAGALSGVVSASVSSPGQGIELVADVGSFVNNGTEGNILLQEASSGDRVVGQTPVALADKGATSGTQAKVLNGTLPVVWKATAGQDLSAGQYPVSLIVTLKDA